MATEGPSLFESTLYKGPLLIKGGRVRPIMFKDGTTFCYCSSESGKTECYRVDPRQNTKENFFNVGRLRETLRETLGHNPPQEGVPFTEFEFTGDDRAIRFTVEDRTFVLQLGDYTITQEPKPLAPSEDELRRLTPRSFPWMLGENASEVQSPDRKWFLGVIEHNLYIRSIEDGQQTVLTSDGSEEIGWDAWGAKWSLDGSKVAVKKADLHEMAQIPIVHWLKPLEEVETMRWARPGQPIWHFELYILDIPSGKQRKVKTGGLADSYINIVGWLPGELVFSCVDREYKTLSLMAADPATGQVRTILVEEQDKFHNYEVFGALPITPLSDGKHFLWISERDGWSHLYLYNVDGSQVSRLTHGEFSVFQVVEVDEGRGWIYFLAMGADHPYDIRLYRVKFDGSGFSCLTDISGSREASFSPSKEYFLDIHSDIDRPPRTDLRKADGTFLQTLEVADILDLQNELHYTAPEEFWVKALDGETILRGLLYKPYDFDPGKQYPVIEYIYGGSHTFDVPVSFFGFPLLEALAQAGFIVFVVDCRGTIGRGKAFQEVCYGRVGLVEIPEHVGVLHQLASGRPYMDLSRVGIFGLSHGGFMTLRAMLTAPDVYHVGVATCPPHGTLDMAWAFIERFNGLAQNNQENYRAASCLEIAGDLKGKLLLAHGTIDHNAPIASTIKMVDALVKAGRPYDLLLMPEQYHLFSGESQKYWERALMRYFVEHLHP
jgi:dipeptidyl-peptidase-4